MDIRARDFTPENFPTIIGLLPRAARDLVDALGNEAAMALLNAHAGSEIAVPKHPDKHPQGAARWAELAATIGETGMQALAEGWGGCILDIPVCNKARSELRNRAILGEFNRLTMTGGYSGKRAVEAICRQFSPISSRAVELIVNRAT